MATDPTQELPLDQPDPQSLTAVPIEEAVPLEQPPPLESEGPENIQVAGGASSVFKSALTKAEDPEIQPRPDAPVDIKGGNVIVNPVEPEVANKFRIILDLDESININKILPNLNQQNLDEAGANYINALHEVFEKEIWTARRGKRTIAEAVEDAQSIGFDQAAIELMKRKPGEAFNDVQLARAIWVRLNVANHLDEVMTDIAQGGGKYSKEYLLKFLPIAGKTEMEVTGAIGETGRALALLSHANKIGAMDVGRASSLPELMARYNVDEDNLDSFIIAYNALPTEAHKSHYMATIMTNGLDSFAEAFINAFLSSPVTHAVNMVGNAVFGSLQVPERLVAAGVGKIRTSLQSGLTQIKARKLVNNLEKKKQLTQTEKAQLTSAKRFLAGKGSGAKLRTDIFQGLGGQERVRMSEAWTMLRSMGRGLHIANKAAWKALVKEEGTFGKVGSSKVDNRVDRAITAERWGMAGKQGALWDPLKKAVDAYGIMVRAFGTRMLLVEDEFAKGVFYRMELEALADRRMHELLDEGMPEDEVVLEVARILSGQDTAIKKKAEDFAVMGTFQGDLGKIAGYVQGAFSHPLMKVYVPFYRTPTNLVKETMARTPVAPLVPSGFWSEIKKGGAEADLAMSKMIMGSSVFTMTALVATGEVIPNFEITGAGPEDFEVRKSWEKSGRQPYSFCFRGEDGKWESWQYGRLAPIAGILAMAGDYSFYSQYEDNPETLTQLMTIAAVSTYEQMKQLPMLQGIFDIAESAGSEYETARDKGNRFMELLVEKFGNAILNAAPFPSGSLTATVERVRDPRASNINPTTEQTQNQYYTSPAARGWYKALNRFKSRNPFFSTDVPEKLNIFGETMKQCENGAWCYISPIRVKEAKYAPVDDEIVKLGLPLRMPKETQRGIRLTSDQYNEMIIDMNIGDFNGVTMVEEMMQTIKADWYQELGNGAKIEALRNILESRKSAVLDEMFSGGSVLSFKKEYRDAVIDEIGIAPKQ